jgi:hypothetical protein
MSQVYGAGLISGAQTFGSGGLGVLGSVIRATTATGPHGPGYLYNDWDSSADDSKEFRGLVETPPSAGSFLAYEDGSFELIGAPNGTYSFTYRLFIDGVDQGTATSSIVIGSGAVTGSSSVTLSAYAQTAAGQVLVQGVSSVTMDAYSQSATGAVQVQGASAITLAAYSQTATATVQVSGASSVALDPYTQSAVGLVTSGVTGNSSVTLGSYTQTAAGTVTGFGVVTGSSSVTLSAYSQNAAGSVSGLGIVTGISSVTLAPYAQAAAGEVTGVGTSPPAQTPPQRRQSARSESRRQAVPYELRRATVTEH